MSVGRRSGAQHDAFVAAAAPRTGDGPQPPTDPIHGDHAVRAVAGDGRILALAAVSTDLCEQARRRHGLWPTAAAAVGRVLTAAALLALPLKEGGSLTVTVSGDGPIGGIVADARPDGRVRGYALRPKVDLPPRPDGKLDVGGAVGARGLLRLARDLGLGQPYTGSSPLVSGEIADDFTAYLLRSEQVPSLVALGVLVGRGSTVQAAGGLVVQLLPDAPSDAAERIGANVDALGAISRAVEGGRTAEEIVADALAGYAPRTLERRGLRFRCTCSRRRLASVLASLPPAELRAMREEDGQAELVCRFCARRYLFRAAELLALETRAR